MRYRKERDEMKKELKACMTEIFHKDREMEKLKKEIGTCELQKTRF